MLDVLCFGEALVDLLPDRRGLLRACETFTAHSGGAPANVAVGLARLGQKTGFAGVVGDDEFGRLLERKLSAEGIELHLRFTAEAKTGLWFVALDDHGERSFFTPTGADSADKLLSTADVIGLPASRWLHCGSSAHIKPAAQEALKEVVARAQERGVLVSFDPNVRAHLWEGSRNEELRELCTAIFPSCTLVKLSEEELEPCLGVEKPETALDALEKLGVQFACVTLGPRGAIARRRGETVSVPAPAVDVVDTTGAGDGFLAALLASDPLTAPLTQLLRFACAAGSNVCKHLGAVSGLPSREVLEAAMLLQGAP